MMEDCACGNGDNEEEDDIHLTNLPSDFDEEEEEEGDVFSDENEEEYDCDIEAWPEWARLPEPEQVPLDCGEVVRELRRKPRLLYHLARDRRGRVYARVIRTMLLPRRRSRHADKGRYPCNRKL